MSSTVIPSVIADAHAAAIIPKVRARAAEIANLAARIPIHGIPTYDPSTVDLAAATAGFDVVVQISAARCLRALAAWIGGTPIVTRLPASAAAPLLAAAGGALAALATDATVASEGIDLQVGLVPSALELGAGGALTLVVSARVAFGYQRTLHILDPQGRPHGDTVWDERGVVGTATITLAGTYAAQIAPNRSRVAFTADFGGATPTLGGPSPAVAAVRALAPDRLAAGLFHGPSRRGALAREVSIGGHGARAFDGVVAVAHGVVRAGTLAALAVGFTLTPTPASIADVHHFIGTFDFGASHSERALLAVFAYAWPDVASRITLDRTTDLIAQDGHRTPARVRGVLALQAPSTTAIAAMASTRADAIAVGGRGTVTHVETEASGTWQPIADSDTTFDWSINLDPELRGAWSPDPATLALQSMFHQALEPVFRPFASYPTPPQAQLARLTSADHRTQFLGDLP